MRENEKKLSSFYQVDLAKFAGVERGVRAGSEQRHELINPRQH
jgi:hypothetical protein